MRDAGRRAPTEGVAEAFRTLRSSVKFAAGAQPVRSVLVVDLDRAEPSGVAEQLARAFVEAGDRVALVETDLRRSGDAPGFADLVRGQASPDAILASDGTLVRVAPGRGGSPDLLAADELPDALAALLSATDYLVLTCAALPQHADALALAPRVDAVVLVVTSGRTRRGKAVEAREQLARVGARVLGVVMVEGRRRFW